MSSHQGKVESGDWERDVANHLIANISNITIGMLNKSEHLETYHSEGFRWNLVEPGGTGEMKPCVVCICGTSSRHR